MAMLIVNLHERIGDAASWRAAFQEMRPGLELRFFPEVGATADIEYLAFMHPDFDLLPELPNLKAMFSRSAGVDDFVNHPKIPRVPLGKIEPPGGDPMMTEYVIMHVLRLHREMPAYQESQARREWRRVPIKRPEERRIGFLGYGMMAKAPALVLKSLGFPVSAWVRTPKPNAEIPIFHGREQLESFLGQADIVVCLLPLTAATEGILCARTFAMMPAGAMLVNVGRGRHVVDTDLIDALDSGQLAHAALDALWPEPLPPQSPLWLHPKVTVMPHVARRPTVRQLATEIVANIPQPGGRRLAAAGGRRQGRLLTAASTILSGALLTIALRKLSSPSPSLRGNRGAVSNGNASTSCCDVRCAVGCSVIMKCTIDAYSTLKSTVGTTEKSRATHVAPIPGTSEVPGAVLGAPR